MTQSQQMDHIKKLEDVLQKIIDPIKYFRKEAERQNAQLDGMWAVHNSQDATFLRKIALDGLGEDFKMVNEWFWINENDGLRRWEFTPKGGPYTSYTVSYSECYNIVSACKAVVSSIKEERIRKEIQSKVEKNETI